MKRYLCSLVATALVVVLVHGAALAAERVTLKIEGLTLFG